MQRLGRSTAIALAFAMVASFTVSLPARAAATHGSTLAWGSNSSGQLAKSGGGSNVPLSVALHTVRSVAGGGEHSLALTSGGTVFGWGRNFYGQVGNGSFGLANVTTPAQVPLTQVVAIAAGAEHSLALRANGEVWGWGNNSSAQLALNPAALGFSPTPVRINGLPADIVAIAAGQSHSLALAAGGTVYAWGSNTSGQLGTGPFSTVEVTPRPVSLANVSAIAAGASHTLAVAGANGRVYAWGANNSDQINDPDTRGRFNPLPHDTGVVNAVMVAGGAGHSVAMLSDGTLIAWGANGSRQLGRATSGSTGTPAEVPGITAARAIAAGANHTLAVVRNGSDHRLFGWGANGSGQVGTGSSSSTVPSPTQIGAYATGVTIAAGSAHSLAVVAPRATLNHSLLAFDGVTEVGQVTAPKSVSLTNAGPGPLTVSSVQMAADDFSITANTCESATLAEGQSCSISVRFSPANAGLRTSRIDITNDGFDGVLSVALQGFASIVAGQISVTTDPANLTDGVPASPPRVPLDHIPLQPSSPAAQDQVDAGVIAIGDVVGAGALAIGDVVGAGALAIGDVVGAGFIAIGDVVGAGALAIGDVVGAGPLAQETLKQVPLGSLPLLAPYAWTGDAGATPTPILHGSALDKPLQQISLYDVLVDPVASQRFAEVPIGSIGWSSSKLGGLGLLAVLLGKTPLSAIVVPPSTTAEDSWCPLLNEGLGSTDCGRAYARNPGSDANGLTASPMEFQLAGVPYGVLPLGKIRLGDITPVDDAPYLQLRLQRIDLYRSDLGSVKVGDITPDKNAVVDCSKISGDCDEATLYQASQAGALVAGARLGDLGDAVAGFSLAQLVVGLMPLDNNPYGDIALADLGILTYPGEGSSSLRYSVNFTASDALPDGATVSVTLPSKEFMYVPNSTVLTVDGGTAVATGPTRDGRVLTWGIASPVPADAVMTLEFRARPGLTLGTFTIPRVSLDGAGGSVVAEAAMAPVRVIESLEGGTLPPNDTLTAATPIEPAGPAGTGELVVSHIGHAGDSDLFTFPASLAPAGSLITVYLDHAKFDADLAVYGPPGAEFEAPLFDGASAGSDVVPLGDDVPRLSGDGVSWQSDPQSDIDLLVGAPLIALSQNRGVAPEYARAVAFDVDEDEHYTIQVVGYNGDFSDKAYSVRVVVTPPPTLPPCEPRTFAHAPGTPGTLPSAASLEGATTVMLVAPSRLEQIYGPDGRATVMNALDRLVADDELRNAVGRIAVLPVDGSPSVGAALAAWDANPCDPLIANDGVRAVTAVMKQLVPSSARYITIVGGDTALPMGRVQDRTLRVNERNFLGEIAAATSANNAFVGTVAAARVQTDDAYAMPRLRSLPGRVLHEPTRAVGRLLERPAEIARSIDNFIQFRGVVDPSTALTTSADTFMDDMAEAIDGVLSGELGLNTETLIDEAWGLEQLKQSFTERSPGPDVVSLNQHFDPWRTEPRVAASLDDMFKTSDARAGLDLLRSIIFSIGCHAGMPVPDALVSIPGFGESWAQTFAQKDVAGFAAMTGYGIGSRSSVALSEDLLLRFARNMGSMTLGDALLSAKVAFLTDTGAIDVFSEKTVVQATFYGMPNYRIAGVTPQPYTPPSLPTGTDPATGLSTASIHVQSSDPSAPGYFAVDRHDTDEGSFYSADGGTVVVSGRPVQPRLTLDVTREGLRARGALITGMVSRDVSIEFDPVIAYPIPTSSTLQHSEPQASDIVFPGALNSIRSILGPDGARDSLIIVPGTFESSTSSSGTTKGRQRLFDAIDIEVLYSEPGGNNNPPVISSASGVVIDDVATFVVNATDHDPNDDVTRVVVVYREHGQNAWRAVELVRSPDDASRWTGGTTVSATRGDYFVQAVDRFGNVAVTANKARFHEAAPPKAGSGDVAVSITGTPRDNGWFADAQVTLTPATPGATITYRVDGGPSQLYTGQIAFAGDNWPAPSGAIVGDGYRTLTFTPSVGESGTAVIRIDASGPTIAPRVPRGDGSASFGLNQQVRARYSCADRGSGLAPGGNGCSATVNGTPVADGSFLPTAQAGEHQLVITARDLAGNVTTRTVVYHVGFVFEGFLAPVKNRPDVNTWNAGQTVPMKWRLYDANGQEITDVSTVASTGSFVINCVAPPEGVASSTEPVDGNELSYTDGQFKFNWSTKKSWKGTCRRFVLVLTDGTGHTADFHFK